MGYFSGKRNFMSAKTAAKIEKPNKLYYGDNLEVLRKYIKDESIDLCYIDPPFNSKRNYNQIYNNIGKEDVAQAQAFIDTWSWDEDDDRGLEEILTNQGSIFTSQCIDLIGGFRKVLGRGSLMSYLVHMTLRVAEIYRVLKSTGSFYLHCDPTASHYLKLICDSLFCGSRSGDFRNEIIWKRINAKGLAFTRFASNHDVIFYYAKSSKFTWNPQYKPHDEKYLHDFYKYVEPETGRRYRLADLTNPNKDRPNLTYEFLGVKRVWRWTRERMEKAYKDGIVIQKSPGSVPSLKRYLDEQEGTPIDDIWNDIIPVQASSQEGLGYPTQKPEALLNRIISASTNEGDTILDAYCGCGTSVASAQLLKRKWIGIDITYQSISLIMKRLYDSYGKKAIDDVELNGVPRDWESAYALAHKKEDKTRKEFEKWFVLDYSNNKAIINEKKGGDRGIDGIAYIQERDEKSDIINKKIIFSVKSDETLTPAYVNQLKGKMHDEDVVMGVFLCLYEPTAGMIREAKEMGTYKNNLFNISYPKLQIVTVRELIEGGKRLNIPALDVVKSAKRKKGESDQSKLELK